MSERVVVIADAPESVEAVGGALAAALPLSPPRFVGRKDVCFDCCCC